MTEFADITTKKGRIAHIRDHLGRDPKWATRGLMAIYAKQTADEQASQTTRVHNNVGFTGADAEILSSFAQQFERRGSLSPKQMAILRKRILKYATQLESIAAEKAKAAAEERVG